MINLDSRTAAYWDGYLCKDAALGSPGKTGQDMLDLVSGREDLDPNQIGTSDLKGAAKLVNESFFQRLAAGGTERKLATTLGVGGLGAILGGLFGGGKGAMMGGLLGGIIGFLMEALNIGAPQAWKMAADKHAEGKVVDYMKEVSVKTGKPLPVDIPDDASLSVGLAGERIAAAKADGTWNDPNVRTALTQELETVRAQVPAQNAQAANAMLQQTLETVEPLGVPEPVRQMREEAVGKHVGAMGKTRTAYDDAVQANEAAIGANLMPTATPGALEKLKGDAMDAESAAAEAKPAIDRGMGQGHFWGERLDLPNYRETGKGAPTSPDDAATKAGGYHEALRRVYNKRFGVDIGAFGDPRESEVSSAWGALKTGIMNPTGTAQMVNDPDVRFGRYAGLPHGIDTPEKAKASFIAAQKAESGGTYMPPTSPAERAAMAKGRPARLAARKTPYTMNPGTGQSNALTGKPPIKPAPPVVPPVLRKQGASDMNDTLLNTPWWEVIQKTALDPMAAQAQPQQPMEQPMAEPEQPSPKAIFDHQVKMREMAGQKSIIDAKSQAETTKASAQGAMAATQASQDAAAAGAAPGGPATGQPAMVQPGQGMSPQGPSSGQAQSGGVQPAAQMPAAQWGQPAVA